MSGENTSQSLFSTFDTPAEPVISYWRYIRPMEKIISTEWQPQDNLIITRLSGLLNREDIIAWEESLHEALGRIPDNTSFKILVDLHGFTAAHVDVHKQYRNIMPLLLASYGYRIGYLDMFPEANVELTVTRGIQCKAMANVHQDETKMVDYEKRFSKAYERYFTDFAAALNWIKLVSGQ